MAKRVTPHTIGALGYLILGAQKKCLISLSTCSIVSGSVAPVRKSFTCKPVIGHYSLEQLLFSLHIVDRLAFLDSTLTKRRAFMDQLAERVFETLALRLAGTVDPFPTPPGRAYWVRRTFADHSSPPGGKH
ncbi:MAG: hypothetical protein DMG97_28305 [Acidobacteria bacterium]|nr:MAG: hypothetical protein DMG97_28305 [Acidobacteriota bacterium]PYV77053.1 MAG: hypothetical protein DMG96_12385 [Acidobacteriota bacterium]